jgi:putative ABC transport system permease protein
MHSVFFDVRCGLRGMWATKSFAAAAILTLALGIGANSAIFSVVYAVLLRPMGYPDEGRIVSVYSDVARISSPKNPVSPANLRDWKAQSTSFEALAATRLNILSMMSDDEPERLDGVRVGGEFFQLLGVRPVLGRAIETRDDSPEAPRVVVIAYSLWQRRFAGDRNVLGREVTIDGEKYTIIGVMPAGFRFARDTMQIYVPLALTSQQNAIRQQHYLRVIGRLKEGVSVEAARAELNAISARLEEQYPVTNTGYRVNILPLREDLTGPVAPVLGVLLGTVGVLLLVACSNVAALLLARSTARARETAVRAALGASRARLVRQWLTESMLLALTGGFAGLLVAALAMRAAPFLLPPNLFGASTLAMDRTILWFTFGVSILTGIIFGLAPALSAAASGNAELVRAAGRGTAGGHSRMHSIIVAGEVAMSVILLVGAGLMIRTLWNLSNVDPGFKSGGVLSLRAPMPTNIEPVQRSARLEQILDRVNALPNVEAAGFISLLPMAPGLASGNFTIEGRPEPKPGQGPFANLRVVSRDYFRAMGIPLLQGRMIEAADRAEAPIAGVVNHAFVQKYFAGEDVIGRRIKWWNLNPEKAPWITIVGVVGDVRQTGLATTPVAEAYLHHVQEGRWAPRDWAIRVKSGDPLSIAGAVRAVFREVAPTLAVSDISALDELVANSVSDRRLQMTLLVSFAGLALALAAIGIYGAVSYRVARRTQEIGVRIALGASGGRVVASVFQQAMTPVAIGGLLGVVTAIGLSRLLAAQLFGVPERDLFTMAVAPAVLVITAAVASLFPALRATRIDPVEALRET